MDACVQELHFDGSKSTSKPRRINAKDMEFEWNLCRKLVFVQHKDTLWFDATSHVYSVQ